MSNFWDMGWLMISTFFFVAYLIIMFQIVVDLFRDHELGGGSKVLWVIGLIFIPVLTAIIYIIARGKGMRIEKGMLKNACFRDYKLITTPEMPPLDMHFIESDCAEGPYGAKGISELPTIVIAPAIANALYNATGVRIFEPPMSPEKVARAIHERRAQAAPGPAAVALEGLEA